MLPAHRIARRVGETFQLAQRLGEHGSVEPPADDPITELVLFEKGRREAVVPEAATPFPARGLGDPARVLAVDHPLEARNDVCVAVLPKFDHDPTPAHLVRTWGRSEEHTSELQSQSN